MRKRGVLRIAVPNILEEEECSFASKAVCCCFVNSVGLLLLLLLLLIVVVVVVVVVTVDESSLRRTDGTEKASPFLANVKTHVHVRYMSSHVRLSVVCL